MKTRIAINGFGRIGRAAFKIAFDRDDVEVVAVNDLTDNETLANLLKFDSSYGRYHNDVEFTDDHFTVSGVEIKSFSERDPKDLPWKDLNIDVVIESTGVFRTKKKAYAHIEAGAKKVVMSAPAKDDETSTHVIGVNEQDLESGDAIISNASCTTNCISPVMSVLEQNFGVEKALMTTVHSYTADQNLQDGPHSDMRRARAAALNIVPTTTGAALATGKVIPSLQDNFDGMAVRVPTPTGSLSDFSILLKKDVTVEEVNEAFIKASEQPYYQGILAVTEDPLVSSDIIGDSHSSIVDLGFTKVVGGNLIKVVAWYDNEWGYSNRLVEMVVDAAHLMGATDTAQESESKPGADASDNPETPVDLSSGVSEKSESDTMNTSLNPAADADTEISAPVATPITVTQEESVVEPAVKTDTVTAEPEPVAQKINVIDDSSEADITPTQDSVESSVAIDDTPLEEIPAPVLVDGAAADAGKAAEEDKEFSSLEAKIRADLGIGSGGA